MEFSENAIASLGEIFSPQGDSQVGIKNFEEEKKLTFAISAASNNGIDITLCVNRVCPKHSLSERGVEALNGANNVQFLASALSLAEGIYKIYTGDRSAGITFIASGLVSLATIGKECLVNMCKK
jgi:hypothetical protein